MRNTPAAPVLFAVALLLGAAGCGHDSTKDTKAPVSPPPSTSSAPATGESTGPGTGSSTASTPPFAADTRPDEGGGHGSGNGLGLTGVRTARQPGFDRIVFDLGGKGSPGWRVEYVTRPVADGSGEPVKLRGTVFLQVVLHGLGLPGDTGVAPFGDSTTRVPGTGTKGVVEIAPGGVFEGDQQAFIGLTGAKRPFRVFALTHPTRLVVDVRDR